MRYMSRVCRSDMSSGVLIVTGISAEAFSPTAFSPKSGNWDSSFFLSLNLRIKLIA